MGPALLLLSTVKGTLSILSFWITFRSQYQYTHPVELRKD